MVPLGLGIIRRHFASWGASAYGYLLSCSLQPKSWVRTSPALGESELVKTAVTGRQVSDDRLCSLLSRSTRKPQDLMDFGLLLTMQSGMWPS